jgi:hypothetical protein
MTKREIINEIMEINLSAGAEFLSRFSDNELNEYLQHLHILQEPRMTYGGDSKIRVGEVSEAQVSVLPRNRELGRWDEYLDRDDAKSQNASSELETIPESGETVNCAAAQSEDEGQAWLF